MSPVSHPFRSVGRGALLAVLLALLLAGAATANDGSNLVREVWTTRQGLPHNTINAITQTPDGYLWIATWEGLVRFNGREFEPFDREHLPGMVDNGVRALRVTRDGALWVGTARGGLAVRRGHGWEFPPPARGLITALLEDRAGRIWIATDGFGLERIERDGSRRYFDVADGLPSTVVYALLEDAAGAIWVGTSAGLALIERDQLRAVSAEAGLPRAAVIAMQQTPDGEIVLASERGVFRLHDGRAESLQASAEGETFVSLWIGADGQHWAGSVRDGLYRQGAQGWERLGLEHGLPNQRITALFGDREGNLWVGSNGGLARLRPADFGAFTRLHGLSDNFVRALLPHSSGELWVGGSRGASRLRGRGVLPALIDDPLAEESVLGLAEADNGDVWVGTYSSGALRWRAGEIIERWDRSRGLASNEVRTLLQARDGSLWIGSSLGLQRLRDGELRSWRQADGLPGDFVAALHEGADGAIWVGTATGAAIIRDERVEPIDLSAVGAEFVFGLYEDRERGRWWLSTDRGLIRIDLASGVQRSLGPAQGLPVEKNFQLVVDRDGAFWLSSNRGVTRLAPGSADAVADGRAAHLDARLFGEADGMASAQCNGGSGPSAVLAGDGSVWFATAIGASYVVPERLQLRALPAPPVAIESIAANGRALAPAERIELPRDIQRLQLGYAGLSYLMPAQIRYRTRLEGFEDDWVERGADRAAEYTNLPPGEYEFRVQAANPDGDYGSQEARLRLVWPARFWQTTIFQWTVGPLLLAALLLALRLRGLQQQRREEQLRQRVDRQTADLRQRAEDLAALSREREALVDQLREQSLAFERQAREDGLTGLPNRRAFDDRLDQALAMAARAELPFCLALIDLDHFKAVNDLHSHAVGDQVLRDVAQALAQSIRAEGLLARWGGEEFSLLLLNTRLADAEAACERLRQQLAALSLEHLAPGLRLTLSIGVAEHDGRERGERLLRRADAALYQAKAEGRNRVCSAPNDEP